MTLLGGWQGDELRAQLHDLLILPSSPATTTVEEVVESGGPPHACDGRRRRRCRRGSNKRPRRDDDTTNNIGCCSSSGKKRSKKQESTSFVTSVPDFDGYRWRKYGQKQIEGAMYARSYYRCTRSAEQGCPAKRTVQRNDDGAAPADAEYTVVYMGEHTCTATDSLEAPVILETTAVAANNPDSNKRADEDDDTSSAERSSCSPTTTTGTGVDQSPAISDGDITWSSAISRGGGDYYGAGTLLGVVHDYSWASSSSAPSLQEMEDFTGPIRSPVHVPEAGSWTIDHLLLQLSNE